MKKNIDSDFLKKIERTIEENKLFKSGDSVLIGLSGGADSTALTIALSEIAKKYGIELSALHINHGLRGKESDEDENFSRNLAENLRIPFYSQKLQIKQKGRKFKNKDSESAQISTGSFEGDLREARYNLFKLWVKRLGVDSLVLAHHRDDVVETVLFRFIRGSGPFGLAGIEPVSTFKEMKIVRPLIDISKSEILAFLKNKNVSWREDSSNINTSITRNRIRLELIPYLEKNFNPSVREAIIRTSKIFSDLRKTLQFIEDSFYQKAKNVISPTIFLIDAKVINQYPEFIQALIFRQALKDALGTGYPPEEHFVRQLIFEWGKKKRPLIIRPSGNVIVILKREGIYFWGERLKRELKVKDILKIFEERIR